MDNAIYASLTRQTGLLRELDVIANNLANMSTSGYRREGVVFSEFVRDAGAGEASLSMAAAHGRALDVSQGALRQTGSSLDFAIEGEGYFLIATPNGERLTRAGSFATSADGDLVTADGHAVLDNGGAPVFVPPGAAIGLAADGTLSADGNPLAQLSIVNPVDPNGLLRRDGVSFEAPDGVEPVANPAVLQGFLESSNVDPVAEIARMIEVQRAYELGQGLLDMEDQRIHSVLSTLGR